MSRFKDHKEREKIAEQLRQDRQEVEAALEDFTGNPDTRKALEALNRRIDRIAEALNLDI